MRGGMANKEYSKKYELFQKLDDKKKKKNRRMYFKMS